MCWRAHSAQKFFNDLALEFNSKTPSVFHGNSPKGNLVPANYSNMFGPIGGVQSKWSSLSREALLWKNHNDQFQAKVNLGFSVNLPQQELGASLDYKLKSA